MLETSAILAGVWLIASVFRDMVGSLIAPRPGRSKHRPSFKLTRLSWALWRRLALRIKDPERREGLLYVFGPGSLLLSLAFWVITSVVGWALIMWGIRSEIDGVHDVVDSLYYSGVVFFTVGFGDVLPASNLARSFVLAEAAMGVATTALVIGYLPTLYSAYSRREALLLTLDDLTGEQISPIDLVESNLADFRDRPGPVDRHLLDDFFLRWELWCADVLESHGSYPILALFRSKHEGQSWVTAIGVVLDAASLVMCCVKDAQQGAAARLVARGTVLLKTISERGQIDPKQLDTIIDPGLADEAWARIEALGFELRDRETAWKQTITVRSAYAPEMEALIDELIAPRGFWGHKVTSLGIRQHSTTESEQELT